MSVTLLTAFLAVVLFSPPSDWGGTAQPVVRATGVGRPPAGRSPAQARLMARRAAEVTAVRNLATRLYTDRVGGFRYLPARTLPNGWVEVTVEWPAAPPPTWRRTIVVDSYGWAGSGRYVVARRTTIERRGY